MTQWDESRLSPILTAVAWTLVLAALIVGMIRVENTVDKLDQARCVAHNDTRAKIREVLALTSRSLDVPPQASTDLAALVNEVNDQSERFHSAVGKVLAEVDC